VTQKARAGWNPGLEPRTCKSTRSERAADVVAEDLFAGSYLAAGDALRGGERAARVADDPHVEHGLEQPTVAAGGAGGGQRLRPEDREGAVLAGPAQVVVDVVLDQRAAQRGAVSRVAGGSSTYMAASSVRPPFRSTL
jgi:hypothetical protein